MGVLIAKKGASIDQVLIDTLRKSIRYQYYPIVSLPEVVKLKTYYDDTFPDKFKLNFSLYEDVTYQLMN